MGGWKGGEKVLPRPGGEAGLNMTREQRSRWRSCDLE